MREVPIQIQQMIQSLLGQLPPEIDVDSRQKIDTISPSSLLELRDKLLSKYSGYKKMSNLNSTRKNNLLKSEFDDLKKKVLNTPREHNLDEMMDLWVHKILRRLVPNVTAKKLDGHLIYLESLKNFMSLLSDFIPQDQLGSDSNFLEWLDSKIAKVEERNQPRPIQNEAIPRNDNTKSSIASLLKAAEIARSELTDRGLA